jgi:hypothetical protein
MLTMVHTLVYRPGSTEERMPLALGIDHNPAAVRRRNEQSGVRPSWLKRARFVPPSFARSRSCQKGKPRELSGVNLIPHEALRGTRTRLGRHGPKVAHVNGFARQGAACVAVSHMFYVTIRCMKTRAGGRRGRPAHLDDPPVMVGTTVPRSVYRLLNDLSVRLNRPKSEILADAIRSYSRRTCVIKHIKN